MVHFIDCQIAITPWQSTARYRLGKVGLIRTGNVIFIAVSHKGLKANSLKAVDNNTGGASSQSSSNQSGGNSLNCLSGSNFGNMIAENMIKFPLSAEHTEILPAAIRFKDLKKDLFIRRARDEQHLISMIREIKILLKKDALKLAGKGHLLDKLVSTIPTSESIYHKDLSVPSTIARSVTQLISGRPLTKIILPDSNLSNAIFTELETFSRTLTHLDLRNNNIDQIPNKFCRKMTCLQRLDLSRNRIDKVPRIFCCKMTQLKCLDLSHNRIEILPIEIKFFRELVDLNISDNSLRMLPSTFSDLHRLRRLNLANNKLSQLPAFRTQDIKLQYLDVSYNPLDGAMNEASTFEVHPSPHEPFGYNENLLGPNSSVAENKFPKLFEIALLRVVRCDRLLKLASEEHLPRTIVSTLQRDVFKCYRCSRMNLLPAYNSTDTLDYVAQVEELIGNGNFRHEMTFMKLLCRTCFDGMSF